MDKEEFICSNCGEEMSFDQDMCDECEEEEIAEQDGQYADGLYLQAKRYVENLVLGEPDYIREMFWDNMKMWAEDF